MLVVICSVDQLRFQSPLITIVFFGTTPGYNLTNFFNDTPAVNANAVPAAGQLSNLWLPCLAQLTSFPDTNGAATYGGCTGPGVNSTQNLFVLEVPRHFVVPNTQPSRQRSRGDGDRAICRRRIRTRRTSMPRQLETQPLTPLTTIRATSMHHGEFRTSIARTVCR